MDEINDLLENYNSLVKERINLEVQLYQTKYPYENFILPEIVTSNNFHQDAINIYKELGYSDHYLAGIEKRAIWDSTIALTIFNNIRIKHPPRIIINELHWRDDTILHELTHISDYYNYCQKNNYLDHTFLEFLQLKDHMCVYLFSEFRAFYRCAMHSKENIEKRLEFETQQLERRQEKSIQAQQLEAYYYYSVSYAGFFCSYLSKGSSKEEVEKFIRQTDANLIHMLIKFLYPLKDKSFEELENCFPAFQKVLEKFVN